MSNRGNARQDLDRSSERVITTPPATRRETWRGQREGHSLSLREVEERVGINRGLLSRIEHGFGPTPGQARTLLDFYDGL